MARMAAFQRSINIVSQTKEGEKLTFGSEELDSWLHHKGQIQILCWRPRLRSRSEMSAVEAMLWKEYGSLASRSDISKVVNDTEVLLFSS